jgi:hypothetical protein
MSLMKKLFLAVLMVLGLGGCAVSTQSDGRPVPPNYYIHQLSLEGGGG